MKQTEKSPVLTNGNYLFTSESVSEGHPDKVADQISDALLDEFLARDPESHVALETLVTTGQVVVSGEVDSQAYIDVPVVVRDVIRKIGYNRGAYRFDCDSCGIFTAIHGQSEDIDRGVDAGKVAELNALSDNDEAELQGAGDQGMMFGYACNETLNYMPLTIDLSHRLLQELADIRREEKDMTWEKRGRTFTYLRPDSKSQVTVEYDENHRPLRVDTIVISTQHDEFIRPMDESASSQAAADRAMQQRITDDVRNILIPRVKAKLRPEEAALIGDDVKLLVNPTGKFVIGGPHGDTGLTGRKIIVDTYGGHGAHGGGAFSGKDPSKVDRSAAYAARHIAKNLVAAGVADRVLVQVAYAIGTAKPVSLCVNTYGTAKIDMTDTEIAAKIREMPCFDMTPYAIEKRFGLRNPIYRETASYGHMGRTPQTVTKHFHSKYEAPISRTVELFTWEKLDAVPAVKEAFGII